MDLLLKIVGGIALVIGAGVLLVILWFVWKFRGMLKYLGKNFPTPSTVTLVEDGAAAWTRKARATAELAELAGLGWVRGPAWTITEMPGVGVVALHHPGTGVHGCYYDHSVAGNWVDFCADLADGTELTVGNPPQGSELESRPGTRKVMLPGTAIPEVHARLLEEIAGQALKPYRPEDFKADFEGAYARDMAWRNAKGGTSEEEFLRIARNQKQDFTDEQLRDAFRETKKQEIERWSEETLETFAKTTTLPVAEWTKYEDRMFILRDGFHAHGFLHYLNDLLELEEAELARYGEALDGGVSLPGLLNRIAADTGHTFTKIGEVATPQPTAIYGFTPAPDKADETA